MHIKAGFDTVESIVEMNLANMAKARRVWTFTPIITVDRQISVAAGMIAFRVMTISVYQRIPQCVHSQ